MRLEEEVTMKKAAIDSKTPLTRSYWPRVSTTRSLLPSAHSPKRTMLWVTLWRSSTTSSALPQLLQSTNWRRRLSSSMSSMKKCSTIQLTLKKKLMRKIWWRSSSTTYHPLKGEVQAMCSWTAAVQAPRSTFSWIMRRLEKSRRHPSSLSP